MVKLHQIGGKFWLFSAWTSSFGGHRGLGCYLLINGIFVIHSQEINGANSPIHCRNPGFYPGLLSPSSESRSVPSNNAETIGSELWRISTATIFVQLETLGGYWWRRSISRPLPRKGGGEELPDSKRGDFPHLALICEYAMRDCSRIRSSACPGVLQ